MLYTLFYIFTISRKASGAVAVEVASHSSSNSDIKLRQGYLLTYVAGGGFFLTLPPR